MTNRVLWLLSYASLGLALALGNEELTSIDKQQYKNNNKHHNNHQKSVSSSSSSSSNNWRIYEKRANIVLDNGLYNNNNNEDDNDYINNYFKSRTSVPRSEIKLNPYKRKHEPKRLINKESSSSKITKAVPKGTIKVPGNMQRIVRGSRTYDVPQIGEYRLH